MKATPSNIKKVIAKFTGNINAVGVSKLEMAQSLVWARREIEWFLTDYKSFRGCCKAHVKMAYSTVTSYMYIADKIAIYGYLKAECKLIIDAIGWNKFKLGLVDSNRKYTVPGFIRKYKNFNAYNSKNQNPDGDRAYTFSLPAKLADKLDAVLTAYGMHTSETGRREVRKAFITLVERKL